VQHLPGKKILPRKKSGNAAGQEISLAYDATRRKTRICGSSRKDFARTIIQTLARHVDFASAANRPDKPTIDLQVDLSVHKSPGRVECLRAAQAKDR
jgi:hypothetical protein